MKRLWFARFEFKPQDCWIGAFWKHDGWNLDVWVCLLPMVPLHFGWKAGIEHHPADQPSEDVWCAKHRHGWCAIAGNEEPGEGVDGVPTVCGYVVTLPGGFDLRRPDCSECLAPDQPTEVAGDE